MKAAQINAYGGPEVIKITDAPKPKPKEGQAIVEVHASSVNPFDDKVKAGAMMQMRPLDFPATVGGDVAGVIAESDEVFQQGDKVWGNAGIFGGGSGAMAEYAVTKTTQLGLMPKSLSFEEAASLVLVGLSATQALIDHIELKKGQKILIQGAAGGIGTIAVQLAKHLGAYVYATATAETADLVHSLGADEVIDYKKEDFRVKVKDIDAVFDTVGGETNTRSYEVLKPGGIIAAMIAKPDEELMKKYSVRAVGIGTKTTTETLDRLAKLVDEGAIKPVIQKVYPLAETSQAFRAFEAGGLKGKIGIQIK
jgi:NADPH:quinone reductase-like Zn-dependent oxidoreductase